MFIVITSGKPGLVSNEMYRWVVVSTKFTLKLLQKSVHSQKRFIREGFFADMVIVDPTNAWTVSKENILYKCGWSPFEGTTFSSKITQTVVNGHLVYDNGHFDQHKTGMRLTFDR